MVKISIIIPVYNMETYLEECLDSVFKQTLEEIEVICIDDASTDNCLKIMKKYQKEHDNMVILSQENLGSGTARNLGIKSAKGEFLIFIDPDDFFAADDALEALYLATKENNVLVCGGGLVQNRKGVILKDFPNNRRKFRVEKEGIVYFKDYQFPYGHQRYIINRMWLLEHKILYPNYRRGQDILFMANVLNEAKRFYLINKDIYVYRLQHKEEKFTEIKCDDYISAECDVLKLAIHNNYKELFDMTVARIVDFGKVYWYRILRENNTWYKIDKINDMVAEGNVLFHYEKQTNWLMDETAYEKYISEIKEQMTTIEETIKENKKFVIYGAGMWGKSIYKYLLMEGYKAAYFVVSDADKNVKVIEDVPVISVDELENASEYLFVLGVSSLDIRADMRKYLESKHYYNILEFDCKNLRYL